jgi:hypothetical protein
MWGYSRQRWKVSVAQQLVGQELNANLSKPGRILIDARESSSIAGRASTYPVNVG